MSHQTITDQFPPAAIFRYDTSLADAYARLRDRAIVMEQSLSRIAKLNPDCAEIETDVLFLIITEARQSINP